MVRIGQLRATIKQERPPSMFDHPSNDGEYPTPSRSRGRRNGTTWYMPPHCLSPGNEQEWVGLGAGGGANFLGGFIECGERLLH